MCVCLRSSTRRRISESVLGLEEGLCKRSATGQTVGGGDLHWRSDRRGKIRIKQFERGGAADSHCGQLPEKHGESSLGIFRNLSWG